MFREVIGNAKQGVSTTHIALPGALVVDPLTGLVFWHDGHTPGGSPIGSASVTSVISVANSGTAQAIAFAASGNNCYDITQTADCTVSLSGGTVGQYQTLTLILRQDSTAGWTAVLPSRIKWAAGTPPTLNTLAGYIDVFTLSTSDGGTTIFGNY